MATSDAQIQKALQEAKKAKVDPSTVQNFLRTEAKIRGEKR